MASPIADEIVPEQQTGAGAWSGELITFVCVVVAVGFAPGLYLRVPLVTTLGPFAGLLAGLGCRRGWSAATVGFVGSIAGVWLATLTTAARLPASLFWLPQALAAAAVAAAVGVLAWFVATRESRFRPLLLGIALAVLIGMLLVAGLRGASRPGPDGSAAAQYLSSQHAFTPTSLDENVYIAYVQRLRQGQPYYPMAVRVLAEVDAGRPNAQIVVDSPLSYRLPTLYWLLSRLPNDGTSLLLAMLAAGSVAVVAAYALAKRFVGSVPALAGAAILAGVMAGYAGLPLLDTESWAGILGLLFVTCVVYANARTDHALGWQIAAVVAAFGAAMMRELALPFLLLGLAGTLADPTQRRRRFWAAWAIALVFVGGAYSLHWTLARAAYAGVSSPHMQSTWFSPNGLGLKAAVSLLAAHASMKAIVAWLVVVLGMIGAGVAARDWPSRIALWGVALGGPLALFFFRPPGVSTYGLPGYWGDVVMPTIVASVPLVIARLPGLSPAGAVSGVATGPREERRGK